MKYLWHISQKNNSDYFNKLWSHPEQDSFWPSLDFPQLGQNLWISCESFFVLGVIDPSGYQMIVSDMNLDGDINILDVVQLVNIVLGN